MFEPFSFGVIYFVFLFRAIMSIKRKVITSLLRYHGLHGVSIGRLRVLIEYLEEVIGTRASVSPL